MQLYQDMALLAEIEKKNERTRELIKHSTLKINVVEESQKYLLGMLSELEGDLSQFMSISGTYDQDVMPGQRSRGCGDRLF